MSVECKHLLPVVLHVDDGPAFPLGLPSLVEPFCRRQPSSSCTIPCFVGPSFHDGSGCAQACATHSSAASRNIRRLRTRIRTCTAASSVTPGRSSASATRG